MASSGPLKAVKIGCAIVTGLVLVIILALGAVLFFGKKPVPLEERLAVLDAKERALLDEVLKATGLTIPDLRDVGAGAALDHELNHRAFAVKDGHILLLSLQDLKSPPQSLPSFSAFTKLEKLSLRNNGLTELPDLSGCGELRELDLGANQFTSIAPGRLPEGLRQINLSDNPISDLSPLVVLTKAEVIEVRRAKVTSFEPLIDMPIPLLDLQGNPITRMPDRLPKHHGFRVDLKDCPVVIPFGYLKSWSFRISQSGVPGEYVTSRGVVELGSFEAHGTWKKVPHLTTVELLTSHNANSGGVGAVNLEVTVEQGKLRIYLGEGKEIRGPWFAEGYVKGEGGSVRWAAKVYADAEPGKPARLEGTLEKMAAQPYYFYVEPQGETPVTGMAYRVWKD